MVVYEICILEPKERVSIVLFDYIYWQVAILSPFAFSDLIL